MRTKTLVAALILAAGLASSMAQSNVYSLNVVGYVNTALTGSGEFNAIANPLNATNNTLAGLFGGAGVGLPTGTSVQKWNTGINDFDVYTKTPFGSGWSGGGATVTLNPGEGAFVVVGGGANYTNTFVGEVLQGSLTNSTINGFNMIGNKVPDSNTAPLISLAPPTGSSVQKWNQSIDDFDVFTRTPFGSTWSPSVPTINVGEGFFLNVVSGPYDWVRNFTVP